MEMAFTPVFEEVPQEYIEFVEELAGANTDISSRMAVNCHERAGSTRSHLDRASRKVSTVPRHREINEHLAREICRDLEVPIPAGSGAATPFGEIHEVTSSL
jgi:GTPase SAR1 family protein